MPIPDFTIVLGLDQKHLEQLRLTWPTWKKHKPSLTQRPILAFYDAVGMDPDQEMRFELDVATLLRDGVDSMPHVAPWPPVPVDYGTGTGKWDSPQRHKMLAGFLHIVDYLCSTPYWLKIDTDAIAKGMDGWIDPAWFEGEPAIIAPPFGYTKPPDQILKLDAWAAANGFFSTPPLALHPEPGASRVCHPRVCGWCDFFNTQFTKECAAMARASGHEFTLPEPSLDGFLWYCATRMQKPIKTVRMKRYGWDVRNSMSSIADAVERAMVT